MRPTAGPINLGNPDEFTIRQLAELVRMQINPELPIGGTTLAGG
jgi:UDP-glucuronate decarboxylase